GWTGFRPDSAPPIVGGERIIAWWEAHGRDPRAKMLIFSDGLDVDPIDETYLHVERRVRMASGRCTNLTNHFDDRAPLPNERLKAISLVCKVTDANGRPAVKLSDNPNKATGDEEAIQRYLRIFGTDERVSHPVLV